MINKYLRKTFLENLPVKGKTRIDWIHSVGYDIPFIYEDISGIITIMDYNIKTKKITIKYQDKTIKTNSPSITKASFGYLLGKKNHSYKYNIGDVIQTTNGSIKILKQVRTKINKTIQKGYIYQCLKDGYIGKKSESNLNKKYACGCPVCCGEVIMNGINDMWTTNPELAKLLADPEDGYKFAQCSNVKVDWKCPNCGCIIKNKDISKIYLRGLSCPHCSDKILYPEKFMYYLLEDFNIKFVYQYCPKWCRYELNGKQKYGFYDFYIPSKQIIIEMDGGLGHGNRDNKMNGQTKEESKEIDNIKDALARQHNIEPIRIDCAYDNQPRFEYICNSIKKNKAFVANFNLSNINFDLYNIKCQNSILYEICKIKKDNPTWSTIQISNMYHIHYSTVIKYLKVGTKYGWCNYNPKDENKRCGKKLGIINQKAVICITTGNIYRSIKEAQNKLKIYNIGCVCRHSKKHKHAGKLPDGTKLQWMFLDEYEKGDNKQRIK